MFKNTLFLISTPENVYLDKSTSLLGGSEAGILTRFICGLCLYFFGRLQIFCFVTSGLQNNM